MRGIKNELNCVFFATIVKFVQGVTLLQGKTHVKIVVEIIGINIINISVYLLY